MEKHKIIKISHRDNELKFLADECWDTELVRSLRDDGHNVPYVLEKNAGVTDEEKLFDAYNVGWINCGHFVLSPMVIDFIERDDTVLERGPMKRLTIEGNLSGFGQKGFWQPMDTLREKKHLEQLCGTGKAP